MDHMEKEQEIKIHDEAFFYEMRETFDRAEEPGKGLAISDKFPDKMRDYIIGVVKNTTDFYCSICKKRVIKSHRDNEEKILNLLRNDEEVLTMVIELVYSIFSYRKDKEKWMWLLKQFGMDNNPNIVSGTEGAFLDATLRHIIYDCLVSKVDK